MIPLVFHSTNIDLQKPIWRILFLLNLKGFHLTFWNFGAQQVYSRSIYWPIIVCMHSTNTHTIDWDGILVINISSSFCKSPLGSPSSTEFPKIKYSIFLYLYLCKMLLLFFSHYSSNFSVTHTTPLKTSEHLNYCLIQQGQQMTSFAFLLYFVPFVIDLYYVAVVWRENRIARGLKMILCGLSFRKCKECIKRAARGVAVQASRAFLGARNCAECSDLVDTHYFMAGGIILSF